MDNKKFNKLLNEKYFLLQDIARKYDYGEELLDMMTYIYVGFYMDFGKSCDYPLYDLFNRVKIVYDHGTLNDVSLKHNYGQMPSDAAAVTLSPPNFDVFKDTSLKQIPKTIILGTHVDEYLVTPVYKLELLAHEVRHALMGYYNTNLLLDDNTYYLRVGLSETYYTKNGDFNESHNSKVIGRTLEEITNTYITELLVNRIMSFKKYKIENNNLRMYLNSLKVSQPEGRYVSESYNDVVRLLYPLLLDEMFINLVNQHQFDGEISVIKNFIENNNNYCSYLEFCNLLDVIMEDNRKYELEVLRNNISFVNNHIYNINRIKSAVLDIKNNISTKKTR